LHFSGARFQALAVFQDQPVSGKIDRASCHTRWRVSPASRQWRWKSANAEVLIAKFSQFDIRNSSVDVRRWALSVGSTRSTKLKSFLATNGERCHSSLVTHRLLVLALLAGWLGAGAQAQPSPAAPAAPAAPKMEFGSPID